MNLLFVLHNWVGYSPHGGTELHVKDIVEAFRKYTENNIYILFPNSKQGNEVISSYVLRDTKQHVETIHSLSYPVTRELYRHQEYADIVSDIITKYKIDIVHSFHLIGHPLSLPLVARQAGAKVVVSFFDYFSVCPHPNLLLLKGDHRFCGYPNVSLETCDLCLKRTFQYEFGAQWLRRNLISEILYYADAIHYLCEDQKHRIFTAYPHLQERLSLTLGLGLDKPPFIYTSDSLLSDQAVNPSLLLTDSQKPLQVACIGNFISNKGADLLLQVMNYYQAQAFTKVQFQVYGSPHHAYESALSQLAAKGVKVHKGYSPEQLPQLLKGCDIALFASTWPETFVLALSEAWSCGLVPVAPNLGAFGERIHHRETGFLYNIDDPGSLIQTLDNLAENRHQLDSCLYKISQVRYPSLKDNLTAYQSLYEKICKPERTLDEELNVSRIVLSARPEQWGKHTNPLPVVLNLPVGRRIIRKVWAYYHREGLANTITKSISYSFLKLRQLLNV